MSTRTDNLIAFYATAALLVAWMLANESCGGSPQGSHPLNPFEPREPKDTCGGGRPC